jgi:hypothetical protein
MPCKALGNSPHAKLMVFCSLAVRSFKLILRNCEDRSRVTGKAGLEVRYDEILRLEGE